jgi:hypothetical protein
MANNIANGQTRFWLQVFSNSKVNGALYLGDHLPSYGWAWPTETYLQRRLRLLRASASETTGSCGATDSPMGEPSCAPQQLELERAETLH